MFTLSDLAMLLFIAAWGIIILTIVILIWLFRKMRGLPLWVRLIPTALVLSFFVLPAIWEHYKEHLDEEKDWAEYREYRAVFDERCKNAGETIYQTVQDVEGITLLKVWGDSPNNNAHTKMTKQWEFAGLPDEMDEEGYIESFLYWWVASYMDNDVFVSSYHPFTNKKLMDEYKKTDFVNQGYHFVDVLQHNGSYLRYRLTDDEWQMNKEAINKPARYAVTFDNPIIQEERNRWIATTTVTILDTETNTILAKKQWYAFEETRGQRYLEPTQWLGAIVCPKTERGSHEIRSFVQRVLIPKQEEI
jgi:hypothetical protein